MDNMLEHPGIELQLLIKEKGLTQKAFASILGKKVSEVNELLKGKRNITIQRDYLLHQTLGTPIKYWILKQIDYDYSLLDIEESIDTDPSFGTQGRIQEDIKPIDSSADKSVSEGQEKPENEIGGHSEQSEESRETGHSVDSSIVYPAMRGNLPQNDNNDVILSDSLSSGAGGIYSASGESTTHQTSHSEALAEESSINNLASLDSSTSPRSSLNDNITQNENKSQETPTKEQENKDDKDLRNRAKIFRTF